jgi:hypothetical protein
MIRKCKLDPRANSRYSSALAPFAPPLLKEKVYMSGPIEKWHELVEKRDPRGLDALLADEAVFYSPVVHTPQVGKAITTKYLVAAFQVFFNESFRYVRELKGDRDAVLEFEVTLDGITVNGVDMIKWNDAGKITEFKVMLRPLKAVNLIHQKMGEMLQAGR